MVGAGWIAATLAGSAGQVARNIAQSNLTKQIGTVGATQVRFLFGLPFAVLFLVLVHHFTGEAIPALTVKTLGYTAAGAVAQIGGTAMMLKIMQTRSFAVTTAWLGTGNQYLVGEWAERSVWADQLCGGQSRLAWVYQIIGAGSGEKRCDGEYDFAGLHRYKNGDGNCAGSVGKQDPAANSDVAVG